MHFSIHINLLHLFSQFFMIGTVAMLAGNYWFIAPSWCLAAEPNKNVAATQDNDDDESDDWIFDKSTYTNDPKTGKRVDQYKHEKIPYRDPNAIFDSSTFIPFFNDWGWGWGFSGYESFYDYMLVPEFYSKYYIGEDGSGYYPYDGDPNYEEDEAQTEDQTANQK